MRNRATSQTSATFDASETRENILSPQNTRPKARPYNPPTKVRWPSINCQHSTLCACLCLCSAIKASSISALIQVFSRSKAFCAHRAITCSKAVSLVTSKRSCRITLRSDLDIFNPSSGIIARICGSTQNSSSSSRLSAIGKTPIA